MSIVCLMLKVSKFVCYSSKYIWEISERSAILPQKSPEEPNVKLNMAEVRVFSTKVEFGLLVGFFKYFHMAIVFSQQDSLRAYSLQMLFVGVCSHVVGIHARCRKTLI